MRTPEEMIYKFQLYLNILLLELLWLPFLVHKKLLTNILYPLLNTAGKIADSLQKWTSLRFQPVFHLKTSIYSCI